MYSEYVKIALGPETVSFGAIQLVWMSGIDAIMRLMKAAIGTGRNPAVWKWASCVLINKAAKDGYTELRADHSISQLSFFEKVVEKVVVGLLSEEAKTRGLMRDLPVESMMGSSDIDTAAIILDRAHAAGAKG